MRHKSVVGMLIAIVLMFAVTTLYFVFGYAIDILIDILSYAGVIIIALAILFIIIASNYGDKKELDRKTYIKIIIISIIIISITTSILLIPETRKFVFGIIQVFYCLLIFVLVPAGINNLINNK